MNAVVFFRITMPPYGAIVAAIMTLQIIDATSPFPLLLVVSFDGFWAGYLEKYKDETSNFRELAAIGVTAPWMENVFITNTFPNHQSIATGLYEESHGIVANEFYDPALNETFNYVKNNESKWWDTGPVPLWILNQLADSHRFSGGMMWPGSNVAIRNQTVFYKEEYDHAIPAEKKIDTIVEWFVNETHPANCVFLYFDEPDATGHHFGPNSEEMKAAVAEADKTVAYLIKRLKDVDLFKRMNLVVLSDHGMAEVLPGNVIELNNILNHSYTVIGNNVIVAVYPEKGQEQFVYETFKNASINLTMTVYKKEEIPIQFHYRNNVRIPPILIVADEGYEVFRQWTKTNEHRPHGAHGYNNSVASMHAVFIAHGPALKTGVVIPPFRNIDLYSLLCHILHLIPERNNGSLPNVIGMLKHPFGLHVTNKWLIAICTVLGICLLLAIFAAFFTNSSSKDLDTMDGSFPARLFKREKTSGGEEKTYLLVSPSVTENL